jgi:hypothetical protein
MANERLYIQDTETGETLMLAKSFGPPWDIRITIDKLQSWLDGRDIEATCGLHPGKGDTKLRLVTEAQLCHEAAERKAGT